MDNLSKNKHRESNNDYIYYNELNEKDFYPPEDNRLYIACVDDIDDGDNFDDYAVWFWETYEDEIYN